MLPNAIWYSFQDGVVETILVEKDDTVKLDNIEKVYDTYPPPDKNFKYEDPYVTDEEMRQLALERVIRMIVAKYILKDFIKVYSQTIAVF